MTAKELESEFGELPEYTVELTYENKKYNIVLYSFLHEIKPYQEIGSIAGLMNNSYNLVKYIFLFSNDSLFYWGVPTDFSKSNVRGFEVLTDSLIQLDRGLPNTAYTPLLMGFCIASAYFNTKNIKQGMTVEHVSTLFSEHEKTLFNIEVDSKIDKPFLIVAYKRGFYPNYYDYFVAYEDNKVIFWGYPYEFNRHENPLINEIGLKALEEYNEVNP